MDYVRPDPATVVALGATRAVDLWVTHNFSCAGWDCRATPTTEMEYRAISGEMRTGCFCDACTSVMLQRGTTFDDATLITCEDAWSAPTTRPATPALRQPDPATAPPTPRRLAPRWTLG